MLFDEKLYSVIRGFARVNIFMNDALVYACGHIWIAYIHQQSAWAGWELIMCHVKKCIRAISGAGECHE